MTVQTTNPNLPAVPDVAALSALVEQYARDLAHCKAFAEAIIDTPFVPAGFWPAPVIQRGNEWVTLKASGKDAWDFRRRHPKETDDAFAWRRGNAAATTAAVVYSGAALGINWQAAVSGIYVANGRTSLYAEQMRALILAAGHRFDISEHTAEACTVLVARIGDREPTPLTFTMDEAITAGYVKGKGQNTGENHWKGNDRYNTNPRDMLLARATTMAGKAKFADVIRGMVAREIIHDEYDEPVDITATAVQVTAADVQAPPRRGAPSALLGSLARREAEASSAIDGDTQYDPDAASSEGPKPEEVQITDDDVIDAKQWTAINARFVELRDGGIGAVGGPGAQANRLAVINHITGRPVAKGSELTRGEAQLVLDTLAGSAGERLTRAVLAPEPIEQASGHPTYEDGAQDADNAAQADTPDPADGTDPWAGAEHVDRVGP